MMNEDTYTPFPYFYDVTAWSQPLLFNVDGGYSSERLRPKIDRVGQLREPGADPLPPSDLPRIALWQLSQTSSSAIESSGWLRYLFDRVWGLPYDNITTADVKAGALAGYDAVVVPNTGNADPVVPELGPEGAAAVRDWVEGGGHWVSWREGTRLAALLGVSTVDLADPS